MARLDWSMREYAVVKHVVVRLVEQEFASGGKLIAEPNQMLSEVQKDLNQAADKLEGVSRKSLSALRPVVRDFAAFMLRDKNTNTT